MKHLLLTFLITTFLSSKASAAHPQIFHIEKDKVNYSCHPANLPKYCPLVSMDIALGILITLERVSCLEAIPANTSELSDQIKNCFYSPRAKKFYEDLALYDVPLSCIKKNLEVCIGYSEQCVTTSPCGQLGDFIQKVQVLGYSSFFSKTDGEVACKDMLYQ